MGENGAHESVKLRGGFEEGVEDAELVFLGEGLEGGDWRECGRHDAIMGLSWVIVIFL